VAKRSAGLLLYRRVGDDAAGPGRVEVLLVHPGGPFWARKDAGAWSIPKGEYLDGEDPAAAAVREFTEELGSPPPEGDDMPLGELRQAGGKLVVAWAREGDFDVATATSNTFELEWPRGSGRLQEFPEVDRVAWFSLDEAAERLLASQRPVLDALTRVLRSETRDLE
jgi:predicted NUDIX family NTP pyrophosphohydrolase